MINPRPPHETPPLSHLTPPELSSHHTIYSSSRLASRASSSDSSSIAYTPHQHQHQHTSLALLQSITRFGSAAQVAKKRTRGGRPPCTLVSISGNLGPPRSHLVSPHPQYPSQPPDFVSLGLLRGDHVRQVAAHRGLLLSMSTNDGARSAASRKKVHPQPVRRNNRAGGRRRGKTKETRACGKTQVGRTTAFGAKPTKENQATQL